MNSKIVIFKLHPFEHKGFEEYLEKQALKGWKLKSAYGFYLKFTKIKPQKLKYSVEILDEINYFDGENSDPSLDLREYCKRAGWEFLCEMEKFQIFCSEEEEILPINTEEEYKFKNINKASLKSILMAVILAILISFNVLIGFVIYVNPYAFASNITVIIALLALLLDLVAIKDVVSFVRFYIKGRRSLALNERVEYSTLKEIRFKKVINEGCILVAILTIVFMLLDRGNIEKGIFIVMAIFIFAGFALWKWLGRRDYKRGKKKTIAIVGYIGLIFFMAVGMFFVTSFGVLSDDNSNDDLISIESYESKSQGFLATFVYTTEYEEFRGRYEWVNKYYFKKLMERSSSYGDNIEKVEINKEKNFEIYKVNVGGRYLVYSPEVVISFDNYYKMLSDDEVIKVIYEEFIK